MVDKSYKNKKKIVIIDYQSGNLHSVFNALELIKNPSDSIQISNNPNDLKSATHIILPGVGAFNDCATNIKSIPNMVKELKTQILINKKPFLGICVGMQLLADFGFEHDKNSGLGIIAGNVNAIDHKNHQLKIPHIGWNNITIKQPHPILRGIKNDEHFYFVHSFHFVPKNKNYILATADYGDKITAIIAKNNILEM